MYHQQQHQHEHYQQHQPQQPLQQQQQQLQHQENGIIAAAGNDVAESTSASNLDHALLESLFYNEMVMFDPPTGQTDVLSPPTTEPDTPITIVEKEILRDFGVDGGTTLFAAPAAAPAAPVPAAAPPLPPGHTAVVNDVAYGNGHANMPQNSTTASGTPDYTHTVIPPVVAPLRQQQQQQPQQQQQQPMYHQYQHTKSSNPLHHHAKSSSTIQQHATNMSTTYSVPPTATTPATAAVATPAGTMHAAPHPRHPPSQGQVDMVYIDPQATAAAAAAAAAMLSPGSNGGIKIQSTVSIPTAMAATTTATAPKRGPLTHSSPTAVAEPTVIYSNPPFPPTRVEAVPQHASAPNGVSVQQQQQQQQQQPQHPPQPHRQPLATTSTNRNGIAPPVPAGGGSPVGVDVKDYRARQLVDQFATLASRLGIDLPDSVLKSLTSAATKNDPTLLMDPQQQKPKRMATPAAPAPVGAVAPGAAVQQSATNAERPKAPSAPSMATLTTTTPSTRSDGSGGTAAEITAMAPTVMKLRNMAEEAITAVTRSNMHRTASTENLLKVATGSASASHHPLSVGGGGGETHKPTYGKRRKKPRLSDCEAKLAKLKAENDQLKRHLQNVSNKAHKFDREKEEAGKQIYRLVTDPNAEERELERSVRKFSDMYSDYGVNRQQELSFHLEQLQRLVNPTNFTKMGLWTLGQSPQGWKKNPIAGILVKELDITPQQGRKILDQSEKVRTLCENLKEAHALLVKLKLLCEKKTRCFQDRMNKCTEILTSSQVAKLIIWINENTQLIENVCPGWGTEHIQSKRKYNET